MKNLIRTASAVGFGLLAVCAFAKGGDQSLVSPSQPHAIISTALPPGPSYYAARIVWLDGNYLSGSRTRSTYWVKPGKHKIGFSAIINPNKGPAVLMGTAASTPQNMPTLTMNLKRGYSYFFAAAIPKSRMPSQWKPVLIKTEKSK